MIGPALQPLLSPRSIAFVGASGRTNTPGNDMLRMIRRGGFGGRILGVNPGHREVEGIRCVPRLSDLPERPDLAVLSVRNERLEETLAEAAAFGIPASVIFASGAVPGDPALAERLAEIARSAGMQVCGPNCMGFYNDLDGVWVCGFPSPRQPQRGSIAFVAHSGSVFGALAHNDPRLAFALAVSPGAELTATVADYVAYAVERPEVKVVGLFLESARDPAGFAAALETAARRDVPVVILKVGRTEAAAAAALTHTGALAGSDLAYDALFDTHGAIRVETLDELAATLLLFAGGRRAAPGGLVTIHDSGGEREMLIDLADRAGVPLAEIGAETKASIAARLDPGLEAANPLDAWGTGQDFVPHFEACFDALLADPAAGIGLFCADLRDGSYLYRGFADAALAAAAKTDKPLAMATSYTQVRHDALAAELTGAGIPVLDGTAHALAAVRGMLAYRDARARPHDPPPVPSAEGDAARRFWHARLRPGGRWDTIAGRSHGEMPHEGCGVRTLWDKAPCPSPEGEVAGPEGQKEGDAPLPDRAHPHPGAPLRGDSALPPGEGDQRRASDAPLALDEADGLALLAAWGVPVVQHRIAEDAASTLAAAIDLGLPVAIKTAASGILHKSDCDGVHLGLDDGTAVASAYRDLAARLGPRVLVARMAPRGVELALGMVRDPQFGPIVTLGAGGALVELLDDRVAALAPFGPRTARRLLDRLKLRRLLDGYRGGAPVDLDRLSSVIAAFSVLAADLSEHVAEMDVNPLVAGPEILALDALVIART